MSTNARIGYVLQDDSILSVYHHWDGYPQWLGVMLNEHYNTDEKVRELIDGGNMSSCYSTSVWNKETEKFDECEGHPEYYGGNSEAPQISQTMQDLAEIDDGQEFFYLWLKGDWHCYSIDYKRDENWNKTTTTISGVNIPTMEEVVRDS